MIHDIKNKVEFDELVINSKVPVVVDFSTSWCGPCRTLNPILKQVAEEIGDQARICKVSLDDNVSFAEQYNIGSVPTMVFFENGKEVNRTVGVMKANFIKSSLLHE